MIDHLELFVRDIEASTEFYRRALAPLDYALHVTHESRGFGTSPDHLDFWIRGGTVSSPTPHYAFNCASRELVDRAHAAAVGAGGIDAGAPALLPHIHASYYAALVRDLDGHKVEFVCHRG
ncbi:MAG TPA: VOC family protein [Polyangiaceae bacterium]|nr:VOC family protein [Polyangiaceae bacterium]